jgi:hypothetical protein
VLLGCMLARQTALLAPNSPRARHRQGLAREGGLGEGLHGGDGVAARRDARQAETERAKRFHSLLSPAGVIHAVNREIAFPMRHPAHFTRGRQSAGGESRLPTPRWWRWWAAAPPARCSLQVLNSGS